MWHLLPPPHRATRIGNPLTLALCGPAFDAILASLAVDWTQGNTLPEGCKEEEGPKAGRAREREFLGAFMPHHSR